MGCLLFFPDLEKTMNFFYAAPYQNNGDKIKNDPQKYLNRRKILNFFNLFHKKWDAEQKGNPHNYKGRSPY